MLFVKQAEKTRAGWRTFLRATSWNRIAISIDRAVVRATPLLGDLISAHDLGSDLARQITDDSNAALDASYRAINTPVAEAWEKASSQTVEAFQDLAPQIQVTNLYGPNGRVDAAEVAESLKVYRDAMQRANLLKATSAKDFDFEPAAAEARRDLEQRLIKASQKQAPPARGPLL